MIHDLPVLLEQRGSRTTGKDRPETIREIPGKDSCVFEFVVKDIQPTHSVALSMILSDAEGRKYRDGTTVIGELVDSRPEDGIEYRHDQSGQQLELFFPKWCNRGVSRWKMDEHIGCGGHLHGWDTTHNRYQLLVTKVPFYSLIGTLLCYLMAAVFVWWWYYPLWLVHKLVYVAIPAGLAVWGVATWQGHGDLAENALLLVIIVAPLGLMLRFYVWAITLSDRVQESGQA